jgi:hypothetical protein
MIEYIYFVKCPNCEDEPFNFFNEAKEFALGCLGNKPIITQVEVNRNDFGECTDSCDLGTVWSWEDMMSDVSADEPTVSVFTQGDFAEYNPDRDPEFDSLDNSLDSIPDNFRKPIPAGMTIESLVEEMEENEDTVECKWCNELFDKSECRKEVDLGYLCPQCEAAIKSRGETLTFIENESLEEDVSAPFANESGLLASLKRTVGDHICGLSLNDENGKGILSVVDLPKYFDDLDWRDVKTNDEGGKTYSILLAEAVPKDTYPSVRLQRALRELQGFLYNSYYKEQGRFFPEVSVERTESGDLGGIKKDTVNIWLFITLSPCGEYKYATPHYESLGSTEHFKEGFSAREKVEFYYDDLDYTFITDNDSVGDALVDLVTDEDVEELSGGRFKTVDEISDFDYTNYAEHGTAITAEWSAFIRNNFDVLFERHEDEVKNSFREEAEEAAAQEAEEAARDPREDPDGFYGWDDYYRWKNGPVDKL